MYKHHTISISIYSVYILGYGVLLYSSIPVVFGIQQ